LTDPTSSATWFGTISAHGFGQSESLATNGFWHIKSHDWKQNDSGKNLGLWVGGCYRRFVGLVLGGGFGMTDEQIAKLYEQALVIESNGDYVAGELNPAKFAELIVRECIEIVKPCKCGCCVGEPEGIITDTIIKQIKKHFGIEP